MQIVSGKIQKPQRIVIDGPEGIGKTTLANQFPAPVFIDIEGSTNSMDVKRLPCHSWQDILDAVKFLKTTKHEFKTAVLDTADWAALHCIQFLCANANKTSIEDFGYGRGYTLLAEEFGRLLTSLNALIESGMHVIFVAHSTIKKLELPDENGAYDHHELKLPKQVSPLLKEWADGLLFINYKVQVTQNESGKTKAIGGRKRIIHTQHTAAYDAKNRWGLPDQIPFELPFDFGVFAKVLGENTSKPVVEKAEPPPAAPKGVEEMLKTGQATRVGVPTKTPGPVKSETEDIPPRLATLMELSGVLVLELLTYCEGKSFIPKGGKLTEIKKIILDQMIQTANWDKVVARIKEARTT